MKKNHSVELLFILVLLGLAWGCEQWDFDKITFIEVKTGAFDQEKLATSFSETTISGSINGLAVVDEVKNHGHVWIKGTAEPLLEDNLGQTSFGPKGGNPILFKSLLTDLEPQGNYSYRSYAIYKGETIYGPVERITTTKEGFTLETQKVDGYTITATGPRIEVVTLIKNMPEGVSIKEAGIVWDQEPEPDLEASNIASAGALITTSEARYINTINALMPGETYYIKPYLLLGEKVIYGPQVIYTLNDIWVQKKNFEGGRLNGSMGFSANDKGYFFGGQELYFFNENWAYDPAEDSWSVIGQHQHLIRARALVFEIGDTVYIGAGTFKSDFWSFHAASNTWSPMPSPEIIRGNGWAFAVDGKGYIGGGEDRSGNIFNDFWEYDPQTGRWTELEPFTGEESSPRPRSFAATFVVGNSAYLGPGFGTDIGDFWAFSNGRWERATPSPVDVSRYYSAFSVNGKGYFVFGGLNFNPATFTNTLWEYNPLTEIWTRRADFPGLGRLLGAGFMVNNRAYFGTGFADTHLDDWWEYIPPD